MIKKWTFLLLFVSFYLQAQHTVTVEIESEQQYDRVILYGLYGSSQSYVAFADVQFGIFELTMPENSKTGMYRLYFSNNDYFDFIYNQENVKVKFKAQNPEETAVFEVSEENKMYQSYLNDTSAFQYRVDSIQYAHFSSPLPTNNAAYAKAVEALDSVQDSFEKASENLLAQHFIKVNRKYNQQEIHSDVNAFLNDTKNHFFDYIDFSDTALYPSTFFVDKVVEYVFFINTAEDVNTDILLKKEAITRTIEAIGEENFVKGQILGSLMYAFASDEHIELTEFVSANYLELPVEFQQQELLKTIEGMLSTALGSKAPNLSWEEAGVQKDLHSLEGADNYLVVFWSTGCSHCLEEIPQLYQWALDKTGLQIVAVALEDEPKAFEEHTKTMQGWIHVLGLGKWENAYAKAYQISSTPSYFVLDADKIIIAKPEEFKDVKNYFTE